MFRTADELLEDDPWRGFREHALSFNWEGYEPHLLVRDLRTGDISERDLGNASFYVSRAQRCVGRFEDGVHIPCPRGAKVDRFSQCPSCASIWIPIQICIFEPQCSGERCDSPICSRPHVVYAAFFGDIIKIGMTGEARLVQRGIEQGADAIAPLVRCANRQEARGQEKRISRMLKRPQAVRGDQFARQLVKPLEPRRIDALHRDLLNRLGEGTLDELHILDGYPVKRSMATPPKVVEIAGRHRGTVIGIRGKYMILDDNGPKLINLADLPARFIDLR
jgi:hypothetical protein